MDICRDTIERNHRFLEESLELVQALGCTSSESHQLVDYVFGRVTGEATQEVGGVMVTLSALCSAADINMEECGEIELKRIWTCVEKIRAKQALKPKHSPLPENAPVASPAFEDDVKAALANIKLMSKECEFMAHASAGDHNRQDDMKWFSLRAATLQATLITLNRLSASQAAFVAMREALRIMVGRFGYRANCIGDDYYLEKAKAALALAEAELKEMK